MDQANIQGHASPKLHPLQPVCMALITSGWVACLHLMAALHHSARPHQPQALLACGHVTIRHDGYSGLYCRVLSSPLCCLPLEHFPSSCPSLITATNSMSQSSWPCQVRPRLCQQSMKY